MNANIIADKLELIQNLCNEINAELNLGRNLIANTKNINRMNPDFHNLKQMLLADDWPKAVPLALICNTNSNKDKFDRAKGIINVFLDQLVEDKKILDFGTGEGHLPKSAIDNGAKLAVGYDMKSNFLVPSEDNLKYTSVWQEVQENGPYDIIIVFDVMDHLEFETPLNVFMNLKTILAPGGKIYVRYHPFTSRHATHLYRKLNRAYAHLVFTDEELQLIIPDYIPEINAAVTHPLKTYKEYADIAGFKIINELITKSDVEDYFKHDFIASKIIANTGKSNFPEFQMSIEFIDHILVSVEN